jgi:signal transduction histidine kinase
MPHDASGHSTSVDASAYDEVHERLVIPKVELLGRQIYCIAIIVLYLIFRSDIPPTQNLIWLVIAALVLGASFSFDIVYLVFRPTKAEMVDRWRSFDKSLTPALDVLAVSTIFLLMPHVGQEKLLIGTAFFIGYIPMQILSDPENIRANQFSTVVVLGAFALFMLGFGGDASRYLAVLVLLYAGFLYVAAGEIRSLVLDAVIGRRYAVFEERQRVMRDLHDGIGNQLLGLLIKLRRHGPDTELLTGDVNAAITELRIVTTALDAGAGQLAEALRLLGGRLDAQASAASVALDWDIAVSADTAPESRLVLDILRIVQEGVSNALKHAGASNIHVSIRSEQGLTILIADNGCGFDPGAIRAGLGLRSLRSRAQGWGGEVTIAGNPGSGTAVTVRLPG